MEITETQIKQDNPLFPIIFNAIFDKLASPLIYLHENWITMPPEQKAKYHPDLAKIHEQVKKQVEEAFK